MNEVSVNGSARTVADGTTIEDVVAALSRTSEGCAVAVNETVVPRSTWRSRHVEPGDRIEVLTAVQGG
jgi:thiamine biosynthesis protein ThiS